MKWCNCDSTTGQILAVGTGPDGMDMSALTHIAGLCLLNIPSDVQFNTHYYANGAFHEFGQSPGEFFVWDWVTHAWIISATALAEAKDKQSVLLDTSCRDAILEGFSSSALGALHHYPAKLTDQSNLVASVTASLIPGIPPDWTTPFWCETGGEWAYKMHTASQIQQVGSDGKAAILAALGKNAQLQSQVQSSVIISQVQGVVW